MSDNMNYNLLTDVDVTSERKKEPSLIDWNKNEKFLLLEAIKKYGSKNLTEISKEIPSKTEANIQMALEYYNLKAYKYNKKVSNQLKNKKARNDILQGMQSIPLTNWVQYLKDSLKNEDLHTDSATALRIIAEFENFPSADLTEKIEFKNLYNIVADAMEGKTIPDDPVLKEVLEKCLIQVAIASKDFIKYNSRSEIVQSITKSEDIHFPAPTSDHEVTAIRYLASQQAYNPLKIAETHLKPTS